MGGLVVGIITALLAAFGAMGLALVGRALKAARIEAAERGTRPSAGRTMRQRMRDYVGPIDRSNAVLTPPLRVLVEFWFALCGFPGLGWLLSGKMVPGILLASIVPSFVWGLVPLFLVLTGTIVRNVYSVIIYLPVLAAVSAGCLAISERRYARSLEARTA